MKNKSVIKMLLIVLALTLIVCIVNMTNLSLKNRMLLEENEILNKEIIKFDNSNKSFKLEINKLHRKNVELEASLSYLQDKYSREKLPDSLTIDLLRSKGIDDYNLILNDLSNHNELIKHKAVLGGSMSFIVEDSKLINEKYVIGYFEDGHIAGYSLLEYSIDQYKNIDWDILDSYLIE